MRQLRTFSGVKGKGAASTGTTQAEMAHICCSNSQRKDAGGGGGGWHEAMVLVPVAGAYWPLATAHSGPLGPNVVWLCQQTPWMTSPG